MRQGTVICPKPTTNPQIAMAVWGIFDRLHENSVGEGNICEANLTRSKAEYGFSSRVF